MHLITASCGAGCNLRFLSGVITLLPLSSTIFWLQTSGDTVPLHRVAPAPNPLTVSGWPVVFSYS